MPGNQKTTLEFAAVGLDKITADIKKLADSVKAIQGELNKVSVTGAPGAQRTGGSEVLHQTLLSAQAQRKKSRDDVSAIELATRALAHKQRQLDEIYKKEAAGTANAEKRNELERQYQRLLEARNILEKRVGGGGGGIPGGGGGGGKGMPPGGITNAGGLAMALGASAALVGGAITVVAAGIVGEKVRKFFSEAQYRARETEASAFNVKGQAGQRLQSFFSGAAPEEMLFDKQRMQAAKYAEDVMEKRLDSPFRIFTRPLQTLLGYGDIAHGNLSQFGLGTRAQKTEIEAEQQKERADFQAKQFEALTTGPQSAIATNIKRKFLNDWQRNLAFQRQGGLSESGFRNFLGGINAAGFGDEQGLGMASGIMGAGGSTRAATGNAAFALQMQRQFDLTNSGQAMGAISGQLGSAQMTKDALIAVQAEGTRLGLNRSDMREENRKFVEMAAGVINQSNVSTGAGVDQILGVFSKFMQSSTISGLEAGKTAYEAYQKQSNIQSGPSAVMRAAGMRKNPVLGRLGELDRAKLSMMPQSEINIDSPVLQEMANRNGITAEQLVGESKKVTDASLFTFKATDDAIERLREARRSGQGSKIQAAEGFAAGQLLTEGAAAGMSEKQRIEYVRALADESDFTSMADRQRETKAQAESGTLPRPGDSMEKVAAEAARMANQLFSTIQGAIVPAAKETEIFTGKINELVAAMRGGDPARIQNAQNALTPPTQSQVGSGGSQ